MFGTYCLPNALTRSLMAKAGGPWPDLIDMLAQTTERRGLVRSLGNRRQRRGALTATTADPTD